MSPSNEHADSVFYGAAVEEIQAGRIDKGLMAKAIAKAHGDKKKAEVLYIEWRVALLKEEAVNEFKGQEADAKRREAEQEADAKRREAEQEAKRKADAKKEPQAYWESVSHSPFFAIIFLVAFVIIMIVIGIIIF